MNNSLTKGDISNLEGKIDTITKEQQKIFSKLIESLEKDK